MIQPEALIDIFQSMFREHWKYEWGAARKGCVDCSGAFVYAYQQFGLSIAHGSNAIARNYCQQTQGTAKAKPGMAAFKVRLPGQTNYALPEKYGSSGDRRDFYHIGLVDATGEYVLNAKSASAGFSRDPISKWACVAELSAVNYGNEEGTAMETMIVTCAEGQRVRLRAVPSASGSVLTKIPNGTTVLAGEESDGWRAVRYGARAGYMMSSFLKPLTGAAETETETEDSLVTVRLPRDAWEQLRDAILDAVGQG